MKTLGISASGRANRITHATVKAIVDLLDCDSEVVSLAGKKINGCIGCTLCAPDAVCKQQDDWNAIGNKMVEADLIIFGAPNYYGTINALGHACLERTFSFRHQEIFSLKDKSGVIVTTTRQTKENDEVKMIIERFMHSNQMSVIGHVQAQGYDQCYTCGYGIDCSIGNVVKNHGYLETLEEKHYPPELVEQENTLQQVNQIVKEINDKLENL